MVLEWLLFTFICLWEFSTCKHILIIFTPYALSSISPFPPHALPPISGTLFITWYWVQYHCLYVHGYRTIELHLCSLRKMAPLPQQPLTANVSSTSCGDPWPSSLSSWNFDWLYHVHEITATLISWIYDPVISIKALFLRRLPQSLEITVFPIFKRRNGKKIMASKRR